MAGNTTAIDEVVDPVAIEQFNQLKISGKELRTELVALLETAIKLNATLGGSTPATFNKNLQASTAATEKIIANNNKQIENEAKKAAKQEEIYNKYLIMLSKQEAARQAAEVKQAERDAKEIAAAEKKAAKLQAIADKAEAERIRKANVQFTTGPTSNSPVTTDDSPAVRYEPIITGNENMAIAATKSAEAIAAENAAMMEQKEVLDSLSDKQRANIELLLALQVERAENAAELKKLTVEDAASGERAVFLTQRQLELKIAIAETTTELNRQTKEMIAAEGSAKQLDASVLLLRNSYEQLSVAERESAEGQALLAELKALDAENKRLALSTGNTSKQIGDYEKGLGKASTATVLAEKVSAQFVRQLVRMAAQFLLITAIFGAVQWLYEYIKALNIFNPIASEAEMRQKALAEAFNSSEFTDGISNVEKLAANIQLAKEGIADSDDVINQYNLTIGKTFGYVDNLNDAQKAFIDNRDDYLKTLQLESAAQLLLADSAKKTAEILEKNQEQENRKAGLRENKTRFEKVTGISVGPAIDTTTAQGKQDLATSIKINEADANRIIAENNKRDSLQRTNTIKAIEKLYGDVDSIAKKHGVKPGGNATSDAIEKLRIDNANKVLENQKQIAANLIGNEKLSYGTRIKATQDFYDASKQIIDNNEKLATSNVKLSAKQREGIEQDHTNELQALEIDRDNKLKSLHDKKYKQDQEILKNNLQSQLDTTKGILEDDNIGYKAKLAQLAIYNKKSKDIIQANYDEQRRDAGQNLESQKIARQNYQKAIQELDNDTAKRKDTLEKQELERHKKMLAEMLRADKENEQQSLEDLNEGAIIAAQALESAKDKLINAKNEEYAKGKLSEKQYRRDLLAIEDEYNIQRIAQELTVQKTILAIQEGSRDAALLEAKGAGATPAELSKITSDANKGITGTKNRISDLTNQLSNAQSKQNVDKTTSSADDIKDKKEAIRTAFEEAQTIIGNINDLIDAGYQNQISKLEKIGEKIQENAQLESLAINNSLDTQANKARAQLVLDAQTASQQKALQQQIAAEKTKQARADKAAAIAEIILNTAIAATKVTAQAGLLGLLTGVPAVLALGAIELAKAVATPIPQFAKGTPAGGHKGGFAIVGDGGGPERITEPGKPSYYSPGVATMVNLPKGTVVEPYKMLPETPKWSSTSTDNRDVVNAIDRLAKKDQPKPQRPRLTGWVEAQRQADAWNSYSQNFFN